MAETTVRFHTGELKVGDIVRNYGMRIRIDAVNEFTPHNAQPGEVAWACPGTVLNLEEVRAAQIVPMSWLRTTKWVEGQGWVTDRNDFWNVQGNTLATWSVER